MGPRASDSSARPLFHPGLCAAIAIAALALTSGIADAQAVYGSVSGIVRDTTGATLPGATVTITSVERNTVDTVTTNESGLYLKERLLPGVYEIRAELAGFKAAVVPRAQVSVDTQTPVNFTLNVGQVTESVTVSGGSPLLKTDRADVATRFSTKEITDLPVLDRNFTKFILLTPGTQQLQWQHAASENPQGSTQTMVNGQHFSGTGYQLDGTENRDPILGIIVINPALESIQETKITSQNYDEVGHEQPARERLRVQPQRQHPGAQPVHAVPEGSADRPLYSGDEPQPVRRVGRRPDPDQSLVLLRRLSGHPR